MLCLFGCDVAEGGGPRGPGDRQSLLRTRDRADRPSRCSEHPEAGRVYLRRARRRQKAFGTDSKNFYRPRAPAHRAGGRTPNARSGLLAWHKENEASRRLTAIPGMGAWLRGLLEKKPVRVFSVALADKMKTGGHEGGGWTGPAVPCYKRPSPRRGHRAPIGGSRTGCPGSSVGRAAD